MPTCTSVRPISVTTVPVTTGVMTRLASWMNLLASMTTSEPARHSPKTSPRASADDAPPATAIDAVAITGAMKVKLVPWILSRPEPTGPMRWVCSNVAAPETNRDMLTR